MKPLHLVFLISIFINPQIRAQSVSPIEKEVIHLINQKDFFKAKELTENSNLNIAPIYQEYFNAILDNAFNRPQSSNNRIEQLLKKNFNLPDSLALKLLKVKMDNSIKCDAYREAKETIHTLLNRYGKLLSSEDENDLRNSLKIWSALENQPRQEVTIPETNQIKMEIDKAGLKNLRIGAGGDSIHFIFDTGANLSTVTKSTAQKFKMKILAGDIEVGSITGKKTKAHIAICPQFTFGTIKVTNAIFLVLDDDALNFPQLGYQINGILGFPVINALHEIEITEEGFFIVPKEETVNRFPSNMALDELTPIIHIDGKNYSFDTGADQSMLYPNYYEENRDTINKLYKPVKIRMGGAGGIKELDGFTISKTFQIQGKQVSLAHLQLIKEDTVNHQGIYGNIGQDFIKKFSKMTLNFHQMFILFN